MKQMARNLIDGLDGFMSGCRYLIHDRASLFSEDFRMILQAVGIESVRLPARSPNLNAFAERFLRSIKESCLDRMVLIGESSLHRATSEFVLHYHAERNHQGLGNNIIRPEFAEFSNEGAINCRKRLTVGAGVPVGPVVGHCEQDVRFLSGASAPESAEHSPTREHLSLQN